MPLAGCLAIVLLGGCEQKEEKSAAPLPVRAQEVRLLKDDQAFTLTGVVSARIQSDLSFRISGQITERLVDIGAHVDAGDVLARLDSKVQEADVAGAAAAVQAAAAKLRQVASVFERQKALLAQGFTTRRDYDQAEQAHRSAQAMLESATAQLATARDQLAQTVLHAASPGIVTARHVEVGQVVQPSSPVFSLAQDGPRDAVVNVHETLLGAGPMDDIEIALISDPGIKARGEIREIAPAVNATGAVRVKIGIPETPAEMVLGAAVRVTAHPRQRDMVVLPWSVLASDDGRPAVWVVDRQSRAVALRRIEIEAYRNADIVVREGLRPGEIVVTSGAHLLRPRQQVAFAEDRP
ncbi:efflux RND transporter periplasmic adaptor subunit [Rhodoplanes azumiensis]|uniref:Efflux RND transporter periplasmic adaptor subunit n=1 Tax=Rhodoplanes azumiensis TaxID=1897628 RepID=A0ABW5ARS3_9BRAD